MMSMFQNPNLAFSIQSMIFIQIAKVTINDETRFITTMYKLKVIVIIFHFS